MIARTDGVLTQAASQLSLTPVEGIPRSERKREESGEVQQDDDVRSRFRIDEEEEHHVEQQPERGQHEEHEDDRLLGAEKLPERSGVIRHMG